MESCLLNDEERQILSDLGGLPDPEKIKILEDSIADEAEPSGRRVLRRLLCKLKGAEGKTQG